MSTDDNQVSAQPSESSWQPPEFTLPMFLKTELFRLASAAGLESFSLETEEDCMDFIDSTVRKIERLKYDNEEVNKTSTKSNNAFASKEEKKITAKAQTLESDLRMSLKTVEDVATLKKKNSKLCEKLRNANTHRSALESFVDAQNKKIQILVEHVEKLMKAVKIESSKSTKSIEAHRQVIKEKGTLSKKIEKLERVINTQNRYMTEIAEGSKVLEDQLQLMDEKFLELRKKLDISRAHFGAQVDSAKQKMKELRLKYSIATKGGLLDSVNLAKYGASLQNNQELSTQAAKHRPYTAIVSQSYDSSVYDSQKRKQRPLSGSQSNPAMPQGSSNQGNIAANVFAGALYRKENDMWLSGETSSAPLMMRNRSATFQSRHSTIDMSFQVGKGTTGKMTKKAGRKNFEELQKEQRENKVLRKIERKQAEYACTWSDAQLKELLDP